MSKSGNWESRSRQKIWEVRPDPRDEALEAREEAVFPAHTTRFWVLLGPPQGTRGGTGSISAEGQGTPPAKDSSAQKVWGNWSRYHAGRGQDENLSQAC